MRSFLLACLVLGATIYAAQAQHLPSVLIERAHAIIARAEADLRRHHEHGRQHLTHALEEEINRVRALAKELEALDQSKHVDVQKELAFEVRLLEHENKLAELSLKVEREHHDEIEHRHSQLPEVLLKRAQEVIAWAEADIKKHHEAGRQVHAMEEEVRKLRELERELLAMERTHRIVPQRFLELEQRLLTHENILIIETLKLEHAHPHVHPSVLPEVLLRRAREIIARAEADLKRHHEHGRQHLTHAIEQEIEKVRALEREIMAMEHSKQVDVIKALELEQALLGHENRLIEESLRLEREQGHQAKLPEVLIKRAREIIARAEADLKRHHDAGRKHLTHAMEQEIEKVRVLERELMAMDQARQIPVEKVMEVEQRLLMHENFLLAESLRLEKEHPAPHPPRAQAPINGLPEELIKRGQEIIARAEADLKRHHEAGRQHLTHAMEEEIKLVRELVKELQAMDPSKHIEPSHLHALELRLLAHENRLAEESAAIEHQHQHELHLPEVLIRRAQAIIARAEADIKRHKEAGRLVHAMEEEVKKLREVERELLAMERSHQIEPTRFLGLEQRLLFHENVLLVEELKIEHAHPDASHSVLPKVLIQRAREIIQHAEAELRRHHGAGKQHLTKEMEREISLVKGLEQQLYKLEQSKHIDPVKALELEQELLNHENRLIEESMRLERERPGPGPVPPNAPSNLPDELIKRAQEVIAVAEVNIKRHKDAGRLVEAMEAEVKKLRELERELLGMERTHEIAPLKFMELEQRLLTHENILIVETLRLTHAHPDTLPQVLPETLAKRARAIIERAEHDLRRHHEAGRQHLTHQMEREIELIRGLEKRLAEIEHSKHIDVIKVLQLEQELLANENRLIIEDMRLEREGQHPKPEPTLPEVLIKRAQEIIARAEADLKHHHEAGRKHLTQAMEQEIEKVRGLEHELMAMDKAKHIPVEQVMQIEQRLLMHENFLLAESLRLEREHPAPHPPKHH